MAAASSAPSVASDAEPRRPKSEMLTRPTLSSIGKADTEEAVRKLRYSDTDRSRNKRKSLYGPVSKAMVLYKIGMVPLGMG